MFSSLVLYPTATCQLSCRYCYIHKNPALKQIDDAIGESFRDETYYLELAKKICPDPSQLQELQLWGGEPSINLERALNSIHRLLVHYYNINTVMSSTNFISNKFLPNYEKLMDMLSTINRQITIRLQLSLDGPKDYTDPGRGDGVTEKFEIQFDKFLSLLKDKRPHNVRFDMHFKSTFGMDSIVKFQNRDEIIRFYQYFESYADKVNAIGWKSNEVSLGIAPPNTAVPYPHTKEDGLIFANAMKESRCLEKDIANGIDVGLKYCKSLAMFSSNRNEYSRNSQSYRCIGGTCGTGRMQIGLLPNNMISACHMAFVNLLEDFSQWETDMGADDSILDKTFFKPSPSHPMTFALEDLPRWVYINSLYWKKGSTALLTNTANLIRIEAYAGNINKKYENEQEAILGARLVQSCSSYCIRDNLQVGGSVITYPVGLIRLFLNGAEEYLRG